MQWFSHSEQIPTLIKGIVRRIRIGTGERHVAVVGIVVIGRNEGERLRTCLRSFDPTRFPVVYVDSGSTDGSSALARDLGADVVDLDLSIPFTAARARNIGWKRLMEQHPNLAYIQFIDGDCEMAPQWIETACKVLDQQDQVVAVCGRVRERFPNASIYNRLCDMEWDTPIGETQACGGIAMFRLSALQVTSGFRNDLIAGEEPELCLRLRMNQGKILRIDSEMALHDAAMTRLGQWWKRTVRAGHAFAEVSSIHARSPLTMWKKETRSNWFWGLIIPVLALGLAPFTMGISMALLLGYVVLYWRIYRRRSKPSSEASLYARFCVYAKFPMMLGQLKCYRNRLFGQRSRLIEYK